LVNDKRCSRSGACTKIRLATPTIPVAGRCVHQADCHCSVCRFRIGGGKRIAKRASKVTARWVGTAPIRLDRYSLHDLGGITPLVCGALGGVNAYRGMSSTRSLPLHVRLLSGASCSARLSLRREASLSSTCSGACALQWPVPAHACYIPGCILCCMAPMVAFRIRTIRRERRRVTRALGLHALAPTGSRRRGVVRLMAGARGCIFKTLVLDNTKFAHNFDW
jgi:hypothetical protein